MLDVRVVESSKIRVQIVWSEDIQTPVSAADDHPTYSKDFRSSDEEPVELALRQNTNISLYRRIPQQITCLFMTAKHVPVRADHEVHLAPS